MAELKPSKYITVNRTRWIQSDTTATASNEKIEENSEMWCLYTLGRDYVNHSLQIN